MIIDGAIKPEEQASEERNIIYRYPITSISLIFPDINPDMIRVIFTYASNTTSEVCTYYSADKHDFNSMLSCVNNAVIALQQGAQLGFFVDSQTNELEKIMTFTDFVS